MTLEDTQIPQGPCSKCGYEDELGRNGMCFTCDPSLVQYYAGAVKSLLANEKEAAWHEKTN